MGWGGFAASHSGRSQPWSGRGSKLERAVRGVVVALACALLVSCGGEPKLVAQDDRLPSPNSTPVAAFPGALSTPAAPAPAIGEIVWVAASDPASNAPTDVVSAYSPDSPRITASAPVNALPANSVIEATWEYNDTSLDAFTTRIATSGQAGETWISFHLERDSATPWPVGIYEVTLSIDGTVAQRAAVEVTATD